MGREIGLDEVVEHFTLADDEQALLRNKTGATRLGFAVTLKFLLWLGRFPRGRGEVPDDAVAHLARQVGVSPGDMGFYEFTSRQATNHRAEIREFTGFRPCTAADADKLAMWLADGVAREDRRPDYLRAELLAHCKAERTEPPTPDRVRLVVQSGIRQADEALVTLVASRLTAEPAARIEALVRTETDTDGDPDPAPADRAGEDEADTDVLASIKSDPGNVSLASMLTEITKLEAVRAVRLPAGLFDGLGPKAVTAWRTRTAVESPSHLRRHAQPVRLVLLADLVHQREREITDTLVELLNSDQHGEALPPRAGCRRPLPAAGAGDDPADPLGPHRAELRHDGQVHHCDPGRHRLHRGDPAPLHPQRLPPRLPGDARTRPRPENHLPVPLPARPRTSTGNQRRAQRGRGVERRQRHPVLGKSGELASNRRDQQEISVLSLHLLQAALVYVNTLMIQDILAEPEWADALTAEDRRGLTPLFTSHISPYGEVKLNMASRLALSNSSPPSDDSVAA